MRNGYADLNYHGWSFPIDHGGALYCKHTIFRKVEYKLFNLRTDLNLKKKVYFGPASF